MKTIHALASEQQRDMSRFTPYHLVFTAVGETHEEAHRVAVEKLSRRYNQPFEHLVERYCALGTPRECVERLQCFVEAGARHLILSPLCDDETLGQHLDIYAPRHPAAVSLSPVRQIFQQLTAFLRYGIVP